MRNRTRTLFTAAPLVAVLLFAACGDDGVATSLDEPPIDELPIDESGDDDATRPVGDGDFDDTGDAGNACAPDQPDCQDTAPGDGGENSAIDEGARIREAEALLGTPEDELRSARVGRKGEEIFPLTTDYVIGRFTVELDDLGDGYVVTAVVVELSDSTIVVQ